ncbi:outer membrane protein assembly factor BamD [Roseiconus lacunae]|uniref:Secreted protein n=1 Tax=Roseiconus lacunae TaxID=2605694 RepID=A0ABT7PD18_9BACT|nr:hypothetical protein [Roseiconus lacunae]MCD0459678.1 hypothetical protein [Roseiconus lacunae]MDM4014376.1 hypothetical protein [Roseiconus lacunae]WRQ49689.1 hypothetical protein U8335_22375 [Stieleria sp. HD01]
MKKLSKLLVAGLCVSSLTLVGCGHSEAVVEAPPADEVQEDIPAMEGMSDEEYSKAMDAEM